MTGRTIGRKTGQMIGRRGFLRGVAAGLGATALSGCIGGGTGISFGGSAGGTGETITPAPPSETLAKFFNALDQLERGQRSRPVVVVQIGDSHTAGDAFSGRLRELLQQRFGAAGRGYLPPGDPYRYYRPRQVEVSQTDGWEATSSLRADAPGPFGLAGYRLETAERGERVSVTSTNGPFERASVTFLRIPGGGRLDVRVDGRSEATLDTDGPYLQAARLDLPTGSGARALELVTLDERPVALLGWTVERNAQGVILDSHGIGGATAGVIDHWDQATMTWELAERDPSLIILAFGTNEGFDDTLDVASYRARFAERIRRLASAAPNASILVVGPPDALRRASGCRDEDAGANSCAPLTASEVASYRDIFDDGASGAQECRWHPPPSLDDVRQAQRAAAAQTRAYFWDWSAVMGGACGANRWVMTEPQLAYDDRVHLQEQGYATSAEQLNATLMSQYAGWRTVAGLAEMIRAPFAG